MAAAAMVSGRWYMQRLVRHSRCDYRPVYAALPVLPSLPRHDVFHRQKDVLPALQQRRARGQKRLTAPSFSAMLGASIMRKRGYHETWPVPDAGHGVQNGEFCDHAPLCARCRRGRLRSGRAAGDVVLSVQQRGICPIRRAAGRRDVVPAARHGARIRRLARGGFCAGARRGRDLQHLLRV